MSGESTRALSQTSTAEGGIEAGTQTSPTGHKVRGQMTIPPHTVVPVVFIPGIMGSNLRNKTTKESTWNVNSSFALAWQWAFRSASTRQRKLDPDENEVDPGGDFPGASATVPDNEAAAKRGWGMPSKAFYGDFLRWLDNQLNQDFMHADSASRSPWHALVDDADAGNIWNAEHEFKPITSAESDKAWSDFFCPVHAIGYNWLQSNGEGGKDLAGANGSVQGVRHIDDIIRYWNDYEHDGHKPYTCEKVILVTHSMGGLTARAAVHKAFGDAADKVVGIVHGELPANGAAAAYHHCRNGYGGFFSSGLVLGRNAAQVTAVFANAPGAMELLPNQQYDDPADKGWLKARVGRGSPMLNLPVENPYFDIYHEKSRWWRLTDPELIDPSGSYKRIKNGAWNAYWRNVKHTRKFHAKLNTYYHSQTYVHYGADAKQHSAYGDIVWQSVHTYLFGLIDHKSDSIDIKKEALYDATAKSGSNPVTACSDANGATAEFEIVDPGKISKPQPGDGTVPAVSGSAPFRQGGSSVKQSFRLSGFVHQAAYDNENVRHATFYSICKLLQHARDL